MPTATYYGFYNWTLFTNFSFSGPSLPPDIRFSLTFRSGLTNATKLGYPKSKSIMLEAGIPGSVTDPPGLGGPLTSNLFDYPKSALVTPLVQGI